MVNWLATNIMEYKESDYKLVAENSQEHPENHTFRSETDFRHKIRPGYSQSSRMRPPREFEKVVVTRAGRLQEYALVSDPMVKQ